MEGCLLSASTRLSGQRGQERKSDSPTFQSRSNLKEALNCPSRAIQRPYYIAARAVRQFEGEVLARHLRIMNVLIIDDDTSLRRTLRLSLELMGHRAIEERDLAQAFETLERRSCDVAFLDLHIAQERAGTFCRDYSAWRRICKWCW